MLRDLGPSGSLAVAPVSARKRAGRNRHLETQGAGRGRVFEADPLRIGRSGRRVVEADECVSVSGQCGIVNERRGEISEVEDEALEVDIRDK